MKCLEQCLVHGPVHGIAVPVKAEKASLTAPASGVAPWPGIARVDTHASC